MKGIRKMSDKIDFTNFVDDKEDVKFSEVNDISEASNKYLETESEILDLEQQLKRKKAELEQIGGNIVDLMESRGVQEIKLTNGDAVSYKPFYAATISKDRQEEAFNWLRDNGHGELIKNTVSVQFGKGQDEVATDLIFNLEQQGMYPDQRQKVEPMTLKAFVAEQLGKGNALPMETFGVYVGNKVKIKKGK